MDSDSRSHDTVKLGNAAAFLRTLMREAGEILQGYRQSKQFASIQKSGVDFTTEADLTVDGFLRDKLRDKYPQSAFLTEETAPADITGIEAFTTAKYLWVIDPLDGT